MANPVIMDKNVQVTGMAKTKDVIFVCYDNSFLSQVAEAIVNNRMRPAWKAYSAGIQPVKRVHPLTEKVLEEVGIHHQGRTKNTDEFYGRDVELAVTLSDAAADKCPAWLGGGKRMHLRLDDPTKGAMDEPGLINAGRNIWETIGIKIPALLEIFDQ